MTNNCFPSRNKRAHNQTSEVATTQKHISHLHHVGKQKSAPGGSALICTTIRAKSTAEFSKIKIRSRRITGVSVQEQRELAKAIKNAREMALLPYATSGR